MAIIVSLVFYTVGAALCAGADAFPMMIAGRLIVGLGVGLEGGTVPVCELHPSAVYLVVPNHAHIAWSCSYSY